MPQPGSAHQDGAPAVQSVIQETSSLNPYGNVPNTDLEQISDWLTKIMVGISIVQAGAIARTAGRLFDSLAADVGQPGASAFFGLPMTSAAGLGFVYGWLTARVWIARLLTASDREPGS